jgi:hypothetical protein
VLVGTRWLIDLVRVRGTSWILACHRDVLCVGRRKGRIQRRFNKCRLLVLK